jgi:hypothetical protein
MNSEIWVAVVLKMIKEQLHLFHNMRLSCVEAYGTE